MTYDFFILGALECMQTLINYAADLDVQDVGGFTALHLAAIGEYWRLPCAHLAAIDQSCRLHCPNLAAIGQYCRHHLAASGQYWRLHCPNIAAIGQYCRHHLAANGQYWRLHCSLSLPPSLYTHTQYFYGSYPQNTCLQNPISGGRISGGYPPS